MFFPHPLLVDEEGLLAVGGDLSLERLLLAYSFGIFPWYNQKPILWWFTHPRSIILPSHVKISKSMRSLIFNKRPWNLTMNDSFSRVISSCASTQRKGQNNTWINEEIISAYVDLHQRKYAHSIEVWDNEGHLVGGLYGVLKGKIFFGESMFAEVSNASKYAFIHLCLYLDHMEVELIDCQQDTQHMKSLGSQLMEREEFWKIIRSNNLKKTINIDAGSFDQWLKRTFYDCRS